MFAIILHGHGILGVGYLDTEAMDNARVSLADRDFDAVERSVYLLQCSDALFDAVRSQGLDVAFKIVGQGRTAKVVLQSEPDAPVSKYSEQECKLKHEYQWSMARGFWGDHCIHCRETEWDVNRGYRWCPRCAREGDAGFSVCHVCNIKTELRQDPIACDAGVARRAVIAELNRKDARQEEVQHDRSWNRPRTLLTPRARDLNQMTEQEILETYGNRCLGNFNENGFNYRCNCARCRSLKEDYSW